MEELNLQKKSEYQLGFEAGLAEGLLINVDKALTSKELEARKNKVWFERPSWAGERDLKAALLLAQFYKDPWLMLNINYGPTNGN